MENDPLLIEDAERSITRLAKFIAVRHAESLANSQGFYQGQTYDTDLSILGKKQAEALGLRIKDLGIRTIITSPLKRTYQTALEISRTSGLDVLVDERIIEINHGVWEGKNKVWIKENFSELYDLWFTDPGSTIFPGGEAFMDTVNRVESFLSYSPPLEDSVLVTHDTILRIMLALTNGRALSEFWKYSLDSAGVNFFEVNVVNGKNKLRALKVNDVDHLGGLRTDLGNHAL